MATFEPGLTPSLSRSGLVEGTSGLRLLSLGTAASDGAEHDHTNQPAGVRAGDGKDDDRDDARDAVHQEQPESDEPGEDEGTSNATNHGTNQSGGGDPGLQTSITWRSLTAPATVPLYRWLNMNRVFG
jgi:hypothetical protein